jgi:iron(II)-dependent oxidoreductase
MALGLFSRRRTQVERTREGKTTPPDKTESAQDPLVQALHLGRLGLILGQRERWQQHPRLGEVHASASRLMDNLFALVPEGLASISLKVLDEPGGPEVGRETNPFLLSRCAVTNAAYQRFVDHGGYQDLELWPEEIWPHLIDFQDETGKPGPRFWRDGRHDRRQASCPVVGICFYECQAYARWAGYRLPADEEWQMAASWRVRSAAQTQRRYPWGDALDLKHCNIWASGHGGLLPVDACVSGAAPNGVLQLIGNTWEWTTTDFDCTDREGRPVLGDTLLKCIRGGAYDTYFPWQATSTFRSALGCLSRVHNVGFRCAMDLPTG